MILRVLRKLASADVIAFLLILVALQSITNGISSSLRDTDTEYFFWICSVSTLIALGLSQQNLKWIQGSVVMVVLGILGIWIMAAQLIAPLFELSKSILLVLPQLVPSLHSHYPIDASSLTEPWRMVAVPSAELSVRVQAWFSSV